jgi:hypothetical protein
MLFVFFVFFCIFHSFTDCTLSFCIFCSLDMPSKNKTANPPMYVVFPFVDDFAHLSVVLFCNLGLYVFGIFNDYRCYRL